MYYSCVIALIFILIRGTLEDTVKVHSSTIVIQQDGPSDKDPFEQTVDISIFQGKPQDCSNSTIYCLKWSYYSTFTISRDNQCRHYVFETEMSASLNVTFDISDLYVYGGSEQNSQQYPINTSEYADQSYISSKNNAQAVLEPYWLFSSGAYLAVDNSVPLFITFNSSTETFKIIAKNEAPYVKGDITRLGYTVCMFEDMRLAHLNAIDTVFRRPNGIPDQRMVEFPIWSTWARYKQNISQNIVLDFANTILEYKFNNSQLEIDDRWESCYGSFQVDETRFPNMTSLVSQLKSKGFRVTLWVHPFINVDCDPYFTEAKNAGYLVRSETGDTTTEWWNGEAGIIDFTNPNASNWWSGRLNRLKRTYDIDSFKFDAGESGWYPQLPVFSESSPVYPENVLQAYVETASKFGAMVEVRVGRETWQYPVYVRILDLDSQWTGSRSLASLILTVLQFNTIGYSYVLPDYVAGNGYSAQPDAELFIRWLQANMLLPVLQLSYAPWDYNDTIINIAKKFINLHAEWTPMIVSIFLEHYYIGTPINRPIWWIAPGDPVTYDISSQYLLGNSILVAPVLEQGARSRDIYLPEGLWQDLTYYDSAPRIQGPIWLRDYAAGLDVLPHFEKLA